MHLGGRFVGRLFPPGGDRLFHANWIGAESVAKRLEEGNARPSGELGVATEDLSCARDAGGLAAAGQEVLAQLDQTLGAGGGIATPVVATVE